jgi:hypothetical protein
MEAIFSNEKCDVFINEIEIKMEGKNEVERFEIFLNNLLKNDDTMQLIMDKLLIKG